MRILETILVAISTYSAVPVPQFDWNESNTKYAICAFPLVGLFCGGALWLWYAAARSLELSAVFFASAAVSLSLFLTGGIHMDGYMDTVDALASHQSRERKLEILKDSNCGAFAVLFAAVYLLLSFGLFYELFLRDCVLAVCPLFVLSRTLSAYCAVTMPNARKAGMLCAYTKHTEKKNACLLLLPELVFSILAAIAISPLSGTCAVLFALLSLLWYRRKTMREFGGVTGDTSGFFLQLCELSCLFGALAGAVFF